VCVCVCVCVLFRCVLFRCGSRTCSVHMLHTSPFPRAPVFSLVPDNQVNIRGDQSFCRKKDNRPPTLTNFLQQVSAHACSSLETFSSQWNSSQSKIQYLRSLELSKSGRRSFCPSQVTYMCISKFYEWCDNKGYRAWWGLRNLWFGVINKVL